MARRPREEVLVSDNISVLNLGQSRETFRRRRRHDRIFEFIPKYGRQDIRVGSGLVGKLNRPVPQPMARTALTEVE